MQVNDLIDIFHLLNKYFPIDAASFGGAHSFTMMYNGGVLLTVWVTCADGEPIAHGFTLDPGEVLNEETIIDMVRQIKEIG